MEYIYSALIILLVALPVYKEIHQNKKRAFLLLSLFLISILGFYCIDLLTFRASPNGTVSGNGNPAILVMFVFVPLFLWYIVYLAIAVYRLNLAKYSKYTLLFQISFIALGVVMIFQVVEVHIMSLGGGPNHPESLIYRWGWFNQYTNTIYFNVYTFGWGTAFSYLVGTYARKL